MTLTLIAQLLISFIVGGSLITFISLLAEKASENVSGIIMVFPTTIVLGFFFLGVTTSAQKVADIVPATLIPIGITILSSVIYISNARLFSKLISSKRSQIILTFILSNLIWFILTAPFAIWKFNNLTVGVIGYFILIIIAHYFLNRNNISLERPKIKYSKSQILFRSLFMGIMILLVVLLGKTLNPFWGGIITMYPAATYAALTVFHFYYDPKQLYSFYKKSAVGSLSLFLYAISVMVLFPKIGIVYGTISAIGLCLLFLILLINTQKKKNAV
jgi:uncharacterized membrane protein (GlpM family)